MAFIALTRRTPFNGAAKSVSQGANWTQKGYAPPIVTRGVEVGAFPSPSDRRLSLDRFGAVASILSFSFPCQVVLSTNVAETSLTIDDITVVIDSGRVKQVLTMVFPAC